MAQSVTIIRDKSSTDAADDEWWLDGTEPPGLFEMPEGCNRALVWLHMVDEDGARLESQPTSVDVTIVPVATGRPDGDVLVGNVATLTGWDITECIDVAMPPGVSFGVHLSALTDPPAGVDTVRIYGVPYKA